MGRGVSAGGGQSSLGYLFGGGDEPAPNPPKVPNRSPPAAAAEPPAPPAKPSTEAAPAPTKLEVNKPSSGSATNNYFRAEGQNCGNFLTDRPSTKVHAAPGGNSSLNYLFGDGSSK